MTSSNNAGPWARCPSCGSQTTTGGCSNPGCPSKRYMHGSSVAPAVVGAFVEFPRESDEALALARLQAVQARKLRANRFKGGWRSMQTGSLLSMLHDEVRELDDAMRSNDPGAAIAEAADVANFCAFIVDKLMAENPHLVEESGDARWARRIKLLEQRIDISVGILRGQGE